MDRSRDLVPFGCGPAKNPMPYTSIDPDRDDLHELLDHIPESDFPTVRKFLRALADPVWLAIRGAAKEEPSCCEGRACQGKEDRETQLP